MTAISDKDLDDLHGRIAIMKASHPGSEYSENAKKYNQFIKELCKKYGVDDTQISGINKETGEFIMKDGTVEVTPREIKNPPTVLNPAESENEMLEAIESINDILLKEPDLDDKQLFTKLTTDKSFSDEVAKKAIIEKRLQ